VLRGPHAAPGTYRPAGLLVRYVWRWRCGCFVFRPLDSDLWLDLVVGLVSGMRTLTVTTGGAAIPEAQAVIMTVAPVLSPTDTSTQAASAVTVKTLSAAEPPVLIDEKTGVESAAITTGALGGTLTYVPDTATPGVTSTHTLKSRRRVRCLRAARSRCSSLRARAGRCRTRRRWLSRRRSDR
jgi:hypothetical protein